MTNIMNPKLDLFINATKKINLDDGNIMQIMLQINLFEPSKNIKKIIQQINKKLFSLSTNSLNQLNAHFYYKNSTFKDIIYQILYATNDLSVLDHYLNLVTHDMISVISAEMSIKMNQIFDRNPVKLINYQKCMVENPKINPLLTGYLKFNSYNIMPENSSGVMWSELPSYLCLTHTPSTGINIYSWSLDPLSYQPSGAANLTKIDKFESVYDIHPAIGNSNSATIVTMVMGINMMRYMAGLCGKAWNID